jgi:hypothetical protein
MKPLAAHYEKYAKLGAKELLERDVCREVVGRFVGVVIDEKSIMYKDGVLVITAPSPVKLKIREMKLDIIRELKKKLGAAVKDIR